MRQTRDEEFYDGQLSPTSTLLIGAIAIVFVIVFCVVVWNVTHATRKSDVQTGTNSFAESIEKQDEILNPPTPSPEPTQEPQPEEPTGNDLGMEFSQVADKVTAKNVTNMRSEPSTSGGETTIVRKLNNGDTVDRIGMCEASGWSKLSVDGEIVYAVTSYLEVVQE